MPSFQQKKFHGIYDRRSKRAKVLIFELLEPRIVFSHNGLDPTWATLPAGYVTDYPAGAASGPNVNINPSAINGITYTTSANGMPILNSYPSAPASIFLDYDGDTGTSTTPYSEDADATTFNTSEQGYIVEAWRQMSIFFSMFNVNVTTVQPTGPTAWIAIGNSIVGGYSQVDVFPNGGGPQSWDESSDTRSRITAIAHEIGHNFGNWHTARYDNLGNKTAEYHNAFDALHGPLMGLDYTGVIHKWTSWHSSLTANLLQDDMSYMAADLGNLVPVGNPSRDGYKADDFTGTIATATPLLTSGITQYRTGIIERLTDGDAFSFTSTGGTYNITVGRDNPSGVDVKVSIYDSTGKLIATEDGDPRIAIATATMVNDSQLTISTTPGTYYVVVESHGNYGDQGQYVVRVDPLGTLNWQAKDIGINQVPGYSSYNAATDTYTVAGSGSDIWNTSDGFQFLYQTLSGNGTITAKITSNGAPSSASMAGIMIRDSLDAGAKHAMIDLQSGHANFEWRASTNGTTSYTDNGAITLPYYFRLTRVGNVITAQISPNGVNWTTINSKTIAMGTTVYIGLVASAVDNGTRSSNFYQLNAATFSNVTLSGVLNFSPFVANNNLTAPASLAVTATSSTSVSMSWTKSFMLGDTNGDGAIDITDYNNVKNNFGGTGLGDTNGDGVVNISDYNNVKNNFGSLAGPTGYVIERSADGINFTQIGTAAASATTFTDNLLSDYQRYYYRVRGSNSSGASQPSPVANGVTRAGAIGDLNIISFSATELVLDWTDASGETSYRIERSANGTSGWTTVTTVGQNVPMLSNTGLTANTQYFYRVVTIDAASDSATSTVANAFTRLVTPVLTFTNKASNQMAISWGAITGATGYDVERSTDGTTWTTAAANQAATTYVDNAVTAMGEYYYRVIAINATNSSLVSATIFAAAPSNSPALPTNWVTADIGSVGGTGATEFIGNSLTIVASGTDIWDTSDQFRFVYVPFTGNATIIVHVASMEDTNEYTKAGLMIRDSLNANSRNGTVELTNDAGAYFQYRSSNGGGSNSVAATPATITAPYWLKLARSGSTVTGSVSSDGVNWTVVSSRSLSMTGTDYIGVVLSSHDNTLLARATFDTLSLNGNSILGPTSLSSSASSVNIASSSPSMFSLVPNFTSLWTAASSFATQTSAASKAPTQSATIVQQTVLAEEFSGGKVTAALSQDMIQSIIADQTSQATKKSNLSLKSPHSLIDLLSIVKKSTGGL